jgi:hypothetical protein
MDHPERPSDITDPIVIPFHLTIPDPRPQPGSGRRERRGPSHHPSFTDPGWFRRQARPWPTEAGELSVPAFKQARAQALEPLSPAVPAGPPSAVYQFSTRLVYQETEVAALPLYSGPPVPPEIQQAFDELVHVSQELADNFYLNHPEMAGAPPVIIGSVLHADFHKAVEEMNIPNFEPNFLGSAVDLQIGALLAVSEMTLNLSAQCQARS